jgi:hypothetical protein
MLVFTKKLEEGREHVSEGKPNIKLKNCWASELGSIRGNILKWKGTTKMWKVKMLILRQVAMLFISVLGKGNFYFVLLDDVLRTSSHQGVLRVRI